MKQYYSICYISKSSTDLSTDILEHLFSYSVQNNTQANVTGILLHSEGNFFQVLEGSEIYVSTLFDKIKADPRHNSIFEIFKGPTDYPIFNQYDSKFNVVKTGADLEQIQTFLATNHKHPVSDKMQRLLRPFLLLGDLNPK